MLQVLLLCQHTECQEEARQGREGNLFGLSLSSGEALASSLRSSSDEELAQLRSLAQQQRRDALAAREEAIQALVSGSRPAVPPRLPRPVSRQVTRVGWQELLCVQVDSQGPLLPVMPFFPEVSTKEAQGREEVVSPFRQEEDGARPSFPQFLQKDLEKPSPGPRVFSGTRAPTVFATPR